MIDYKELVTEFENNPGFANAKNTRVVAIMTLKEIKHEEEHANRQVYAADNELWHQYWTAIKREALTWKQGSGTELKENLTDAYRERNIGCKQLMQRAKPLKSRIFSSLETKEV